MMNSSDIAALWVVPKPRAVAIPWVAFPISVFKTPMLVALSMSVRSVTSAMGMCITTTFDSGPSMMIRFGPGILMFSKTLPADCAIKVLIAARVAGPTPLWMSLAIVRPFESATTDPRTPRTFRRSCPRTSSSWASIPSNPARLAVLPSSRRSARCTGIILCRANVRQRRHGLSPERRAPGRAVRRANLPPRPDDEEEFEDAVGNRREEEEERTREDRGGKDRSKRREGEGEGQDDESERESAEEPLDPIGHDEHASPPDVFLHAHEGDVGETQDHRDSGHDSLEQGEQDQLIQVHRGPPGVRGMVKSQLSHDIVVAQNVRFWNREDARSQESV